MNNCFQRRRWSVEILFIFPENFTDPFYYIELNKSAPLSFSACGAKSKETCSKLSGAIFLFNVKGATSWSLRSHSIESGNRGTSSVQYSRYTTYIVVRSRERESSNDSTGKYLAMASLLNHDTMRRITAAQKTTQKGKLLYDMYVHLFYIQYSIVQYTKRCQNLIGNHE